jgi:hypothetical protein
MLAERLVRQEENQMKIKRTQLLQPKLLRNHRILAIKILMKEKAYNETYLPQRQG